MNWRHFAHVIYETLSVWKRLITFFRDDSAQNADSPCNVCDLASS